MVPLPLRISNRSEPHSRGVQDPRVQVSFITPKQNACSVQGCRSPCTCRAVDNAMCAHGHDAVDEQSPNKGDKVCAQDRCNRAHASCRRKGRFNGTDAIERMRHAVRRGGHRDVGVKKHVHKLQPGWTRKAMLATTNSEHSKADDKIHDDATEVHCTSTSHAQHEHAQHEHTPHKRTAQGSRQKFARCT